MDIVIVEGAEGNEAVFIFFFLSNYYQIKF